MKMDQKPNILPKSTPTPTPPPPMSSMSKRRATMPNPDSKKFKPSKEPPRDYMDDYDDPQHKQTGHRPVTSCTFCRQHKIRCNASERLPAPCQRCERMNLKCEIDPQFRPKKGSQIQSLRNDVDDLKSKIEYLQKNESLIAQALATRNLNFNSLVNGSTNLSDYALNSGQNNVGMSPNNFRNNNTGSSGPSPLLSVGSPQSVKTYLKSEPNLLSSETRIHSSRSPASIPELLNDSAPINHSESLPPVLEQAASFSPADSQSSLTANITEFVLGDVRLPISKANQLHDKFMKDYLPFLPILNSRSAVELYQQSQLLFWTVCLTASLSELDPSLYMSLSSLIRQLAIETCWIRTPRSTHIIQALLILSIWPLPNEKVLDDASYRFVGLAKNLGSQLGLHRGRFIDEFSRTQVSLPNAELWRTRSWLCIFFAEQFWSSCLGLPPSLQTDYLLENARIDQSLPKNFRCLISLSIFQSKLVNVMGISVTSPDGLMEPQNRAGTLAILDRELERLLFKLEIEDYSIEIYSLYVKLMICCFGFLPETPIEDQTKYVTEAYLAATRIVTIISKMVETNQLIELPIYVRHSVTYAVLMLFRLHLTKYLLDKYIDSARQSIVTVHRLFRNTSSSWKDLKNDISRTARVLENLNFVLYTHPELFVKKEGIISRMRSHLTNSLFYDLIWCVHEAKRRTLYEKSKGDKKGDVPNEIDNKIPTGAATLSKKTAPLPFYNQITKDNFTTMTTTTPNGTTITTLVPTDEALNQATANATAAGLAGPTEINGIPIAILEATGSVNDTIPSGSGRNSKLMTPVPVAKNEEKNLRPPPQNIAIQPQPTPANRNTGFLGNPPISNPAFATESNMNNQIMSPGLSSLLEGGLYPNQAANQMSNFDERGENANLADQIDTFFQQQSAGWTENNDDFLGWFDINMAPEF